MKKNSNLFNAFDEFDQKGFFEKELAQVDADLKKKVEQISTSLTAPSHEGSQLRKINNLSHQLPVLTVKREILAALVEHIHLMEDRGKINDFHEMLMNFFLHTLEQKSVENQSTSRDDNREKEILDAFVTNALIVLHRSKALRRVYDY